MITQNESFTSYQKMVITLLAVLQFLVTLDFMIISPLGDILTNSLDITPKQFGVLVSSYAFSAAITGFVAAGFVDSFDRKKVLIFFSAGFILATLFCATSNSYYALLISRIFAGIFGGVIGSLVMTIISDLFTVGQRGRATTMVQTAFAASQVLGIPFGIFIANRLDWNFTFLAIVFVSLAVLALILLKMRPLVDHLNAKSKKNPLEHLWVTIRTKEHQLGYVAIIILAMGMMINPFVSIFLVNNVQLTNEQLPLVFMVTGAAGLVVMPTVGKLSDRFDKFKVFLVGSAATIVLVLAYTHLPVVPLWIAAIMNVGLFAVVMSRMGPFMAINSMLARPANRGAYMSISISLQQLAGGLAIVTAGSITYQATPSSPLQNFDTLGYVVVGMTVLGCFVVYRVYKLATH